MKINFAKGHGFVPAIVQDQETLKVLMLGYMDKAAYEKTVKEGKVTFFSRSQKRLWTKGETSRNYLFVKQILTDCDRDTLLIKATPVGPVCHTGQDTCFNEENKEESNFLLQLEAIIQDRKKNPRADSYTTRLFDNGIKKIAQKVGEEATELVLETQEEDLAGFKNEAADLIYHLLVLLVAKNLQFRDILDVLEERHQPDE
jgi:phosphoribosyl-ATP pyrophosphohydrolase/phosphoribosyl-AMP cyclohydrolase